MTMQTDVKASHLNQSGFATGPNRTRLRGFFAIPTSTAGTVNVFDTLTAPVTTGTYGRSGTTVTVSLTAHGYQTGQSLGLAFSSGTGGSATNGNYKITVVDANTFTVTDINSGTITGTPAVSIASAWMVSFDTNANVAAVISVKIPGEGILAYNQMYVQMTNENTITVFYG